MTQYIMYKLTLILFSIFLNNIVLLSQGYDWRFRTEKLKGDAKTALVKSSGCCSKKLDWTVLQVFDKNGHIIKQDSYYLNELRSKYIYAYDSLGYDYRFIDGDKVCQVRLRIKDNKIIDYISTDSIPYSQIKCNDFIYDSKGRLKSYTYNFETTTLKYRFIYDSKSRIKTLYTIDSNNTISSILKYRYDRKNNVKKIITTEYLCTNRQQFEDETFDEFLNNDNLERIYEISRNTQKFRYCYDKFGNWIRKYQKLGLFYRLVEKREIKY
jgi:hypothetical protein